MNRENIQLCITALEGATSLDMSRFGAVDGEPGCVLGHLASRTDLQSVFELGEHGGLWCAKTGTRFCVDHEFVSEFFGLDCDVIEILFGAEGCGNAQTPQEAISFLRAFLHAS